MKSIKTFVWGLTLAGLMTACSDNFVDIQPENEINSENFFNTPEDYESAIIAGYDLLSTTYLNSMIGEMASDNTLCGGENANDVPAFQEIDDMEHGVVNDQLRNIWNWMYAGINRTNYIFEFRDKIDFDGKQAILGEAAFLRAYYYFELVKFFGDVPLPVDKRVEFGDETGFDRAPASEVYAQIEADLQFAAERLPVVPSQAGRATSGAALALLGKVYLYQDKFGPAASTLDQVINSGQYDLVTDYDAMWEEGGENGIESVFEVQYTDQQGASFDCFACSEGNIAVGFNGIRGYNGPIYADGFSFNVPTQELVDAFEAGDLRYAATILDIQAFSDANGGVDWVEGFEHTGYYNHKYIARAGEQSIGDTRLTSNRNYRAIRFADVLLMAAEANSRGSIDEAKAQNYLNRVRSRAGLADVSASGNALTTAIYQERRVELAGEGQHFFDLVRTGRAADEIDGFVAGKHELFPIPVIEIELAGNRWNQNPGYN